MNFRHGEAGYFYSKPVCRSIRRLKRGQYVYEQLFCGVLGGHPSYYMMSETFKVKFLNLKSGMEMKHLTNEEALAWAKANVDDEVYQKLEDLEKKYSENSSQMYVRPRTTAN